MSTARFNTLQNAAGSKSVPVDTVVDGSAKAWVNFNGTGTVAIRHAFNVSSITDNGTGDYTVNFTNAMADVNYAAVGSIRRTSFAVAEHSLLIGDVNSSTTYTTSSFRVFCYDRTNNAYYDTQLINIAVFR